MAGIFDIQAYMPDGLEDPGLAILCYSRERNHNEISIITFEHIAMRRVLDTLVWPLPTALAVIPRSNQIVSSCCDDLLFVYYPRCHYHHPKLMHIQWTWVPRTRVVTGHRLQIIFTSWGN